MTSAAPNTSLYVKNLDSKIKKTELRRQLYALFNSYGRVIDIIATKAGGMRGQAFVVFADLASATAALRALNSFDFYDRPMHIEYAQNKSKATIVRELGPEALFDPKVLATTKKGGLQANEPGKGRITYSNAQQKDKKRSHEEVGDEDEEDEGEDDEPVSKLQKTADEDDEAMEMEDDDEEQAGPSTAAPSAPPKPEAGEVPNDTLYCPGLSEDVTDEMLGVLFSQHPGFVSVEMFPEEAPSGKRGKAAKKQYAFVKYENADRAQVAMKALDKFKLAPRKVLHVHWSSRE